MAFNLFTSNRMEELTRGLAETVARPLADEFASEIIVVQSRGMDRYLSLNLSEIFGVWANCRYPFPNAFVDELCQSLLPDEAVSKHWSREMLAWRVLRLIERPDACPELRPYLERGGLRGFQLARNLADVFDQYQIFRPDLLSAWQAGRLLYAGAHGEAWQADLWRQLVSEDGGHRAALYERLLAELPRADRRKLPQRVSLFGISYLPPVYLAVFAALSEIIEVNIFSLSPCAEYWADLVSLKEQARREPEPYLNVGNALLAALGRQSRAFFDALSEYDAGQGWQAYSEAQPSLLGKLQNEILLLTELPAVAPDMSLQVHSCHSRLRELEVLHDRLLDLLERDAALKPEEIVVMAPDIEAYAPYVAAVFEREPRLAYNVADRPLKRSGGAAASFMQLLTLAETRLSASAVLGLIELPAFSEKLGFGPNEQELVRRWVMESGIRWGRDAAHRASLGLPAENQNTWQAGLDRLLIGYAAGGDEFSAGILAYEVEPDAALTLGRFDAFCQRVFDFSQECGEARTLSAWRELLEALLNELFEQGDEAQYLRDQLVLLTDIESKAGYAAAVPLAVVRAQLEERLSREVSAAGFLSGGVTFCSLLPMRSIPFKAVCLLGIGHDEFPRRQRSSGFDLIARFPRRGDRNKRDDDLYLFLETILAARQTLYLSYVGQSQQGAVKLPPSVLVSEVLDYLGLGEGFITVERLQAFSPAYFDGRLFSYSAANCAAARLVQHPAANALSDWPLAEPEDFWRELTLDELIRFLRKPCAFLLEKRLGCLSVRPADLPQDREPFDLDALERYALRGELLSHFDELGGERLRAKGLLPHGGRGQAAYLEQRGELAELAAAVRANPLSGYEFVELKLSGFKLTASIETGPDGRLLLARPGHIRAVDKLELWLKLLALAAAGRPAHGSVLGLKDGLERCDLSAPANAANILEDLLKLYWRGLREPLSFFAETSLAYAEAWLKYGDEPKAMARARESFGGNQQKTGEGEDLAVRRCFAGREALDAEFRQTAVLVWEPFIKQHAEAGRA